MIHHLLDSSVDILLYTFTIEDMSASGLDRVFGNIVTEPAHSCLAELLLRELARVLLALQDEVRLGK